MMKFTVDDAIPYLRGVLEPYGEVEYLPGNKISRADLLATDAMIIRTRTKCNEALLAGTPVKFIATATIGTDHIDGKALDRMGIQYVNAPGCNARSVAQYIASVIFRDTHDPAGKTIGIIGAGHVGTQVESVAVALGMNVLRNDPPRARKEGPAGFVPLETILKESDYVTLHTPLDMDSPDRTWHLANEEFFCKMAKQPLFINASRGEVTDPAALIAALLSKKIRGAALDVWEDEPEIDPELLAMVRYATPHIAGYSADGKANGTMMSVRALADFFGLEPLKDFQPQGVPMPETPVITPDPGHAVRDCVLASYDVLRDDALLRGSPETFEAQRKHYPLRREFGAYRIGNPEALHSSAMHTLKNLGFTIS